MTTREKVLEMKTQGLGTAAISRELGISKTTVQRHASPDVRAKQYARTYKKRRENKLRAIEYKGGKCERCGYNKCEAALDFHHVDPKMKTAEIKDLVKNCGFEKLKIELDKCILLCANCHREEHFTP